MLALTLQAAKNAAWLMKTIAQKAALVAVLGLLAILVWTQRDSLDDCADRVKASRAAGDSTDPTCSFLGREITIRS